LTVPNHTITIGLFDSGVGGLSVLRQLEKLSARSDGRQYRFVYVGDTARCPYGNRESREIDKFVEEIIGWLLLHNCDHVVMACNTSAALSLAHAKRMSPVPVHNLIVPTAQHIAANYRKVGVLATYSTIKSRAFSRAVRKLNSQVEVVEIACPDLVPLVESGFIDGEQTGHVLSQYANQLRKDGVEAVVLGCTHFPFLSGALRELLPETIELIDPAKLLLQEFDSTLRLIDCAKPAFGQRASMFVTGDVDSFAGAAMRCLGLTSDQWREAGTISGVSLEELAGAYDRALSETSITNVILLPSSAAAETAERRSSIGS
jgi:glutamate racemase